jgi:tRNA pseudouridine55 synthase
VVLVGEATKIAAVSDRRRQGLRGELELGVETDTLDAEGRWCASGARGGARRSRGARGGRWPVRRRRPADAADVLGGPRRGPAPPRARRAGAEVERAPRPIEIRRFDLVGFEPPRAAFAVDCSKGTYVRSLVADLGRRSAAART